MADETPRLGLGTFDPGDEWDHTDTVEAVDEHAILRGPIADRPEEGTYDDELYHATDQHVTWRWDGESEDWVYFGGKGTAEEPVPGTSYFEKIQAEHGRTKETPVWNVEAHGIAGDGETEVGEDVHELLGTVADAGGGIVFFPPGRYLFERTPLIGEETIIRGAGPSTVFEGVRPDGEEGRALISNRGYDETGYNGASNWGIRDIRIDSPESNGIMPAHASNVELSNIYGDRIYYHHIDIVSSKNVVVDGYWATRGGEGHSDAPFQFDNQTEGVNANAIWDGQTAFLSEDDGTPTRNSSLQRFEIDVENGPDYGVEIHRDGNESLTIRNGTISGCQDAAIRADGGIQIGDVLVSHVTCYENARGIRLGQQEDGRDELKLDAITIRTSDDELADGTGIYASGFERAQLTSVSVEGAFTNTFYFDDIDDLQLQSCTSTGAVHQAYRFRKNVCATVTGASAIDCGTVAIYAGEGSSVAYGGVRFENVGTEVEADGEIREWKRS